RHCQCSRRAGQAGSLFLSLPPPACSLSVTSASYRVDELLNPVVDAAVRVLAQNGALGLVVQLQMNPVHREVPTFLLGPADEVAPQLRAGRLWRHVLGLEYREVRGHPVDRASFVQGVV